MGKSVALLLLVLSPIPAWADAPCPQEKAVYTGADGYGMTFKPVDSDAASATHRFDLLKDKTALTGYMMESEEPVRSIAHVEKDCPEGDVTGDDIAACTAYEGYVYAISADGKAGNLPAAKEPAAASILLSGLGPSLAASPLAEKLKLSAPSADLFTFKECAP